MALPSTSWRSSSDHGMPRKASKPRRARVVAINQHSSDPHFDPRHEVAAVIATGDWLLIDLWARMQDENAMYGDITWTAFVGAKPSPQHRKVFEIVTGARDAALAELQRGFEAGETLRGWQVDQVTRDHISRAGFGDYFGHRLGHSPRT